MTAAASLKPPVILDPDEHEQRYTDPPEAFAHVARTLRDEILPDPSIHTIYVMIGPPGSGKSTWAKENAAPGSCILDACHAYPPKRKAILGRLKRCGKRAVAVWMRTPLFTCWDQDARRGPPKTVGRTKIGAQYEEIESNPPRLSQGWDEVIEVKP